MKQHWLYFAAALVSLCQGQTVVQESCTTDKDEVDISIGNANIILGGLFEIRTKSASGCGVPDGSNMQIFEATKYAVGLLNNFSGNNPYISGIKFGLKAYDTCYSPIKTMKILEKLYPQLATTSSSCQQNASLVLGLVGSLSSTTAKPLAELTGQFMISAVSPAAKDSSLSSKSKYPTFLRTAPSYTIYAKAIVELLLQLQWQNVVVIYVDDDDGHSGYQQLLQASYSRGICISSSLALDDSRDKATYKTALISFGLSSYNVIVVIASGGQTQVILNAANEISGINAQWVLSDLDITIDQSSLTQAHGALVVVPKFPTVSDFMQRWSQTLTGANPVVDNPWFSDWFQVTYNSCLSKPCPTVVQQSQYVVPAIKAVFAYAEAVKTLCSSGSLCTGLSSITPEAFSNALRTVDFTFPNNFPVFDLRGQRVKFDDNGDPAVSDFSVLNYHNRNGTYSFEEIGVFTSDVLTLSRLPTLYDISKLNILANKLIFTCQSLTCQSCILPQRNVNFQYQQGDVVLASLAQAHQLGRSPFTCGSGIVPRLASLAAVEWAIKQYKTNNPTKLNGVSLGYLTADICPDSFVAKSFLTDLFSGNNHLIDQSGLIVSPDNIYTFIDLTESDVTKTISPILSSYKIPEIEVVGSTTFVTNGGDTPYFNRAVPNDEIFYKAVSILLQNLNWKYVQVATHSSGVYDEMTQVFIKVAASYGICVVKVAVQFDDGSYSNMVTELLSMRETQVVVVIGSADDVRGLLGAIKNSNTTGLQLVAGTDKWPRNTEFMQGLESAAENAIILDLAMDNSSSFTTYLTSLSRVEIKASTFLRELFEISNKCSLDASTRTLYTRICDLSDNFGNIYQGRTPYVIQSVNSVLDKFHEVIQEICTSSYKGLCTNFRSSANISQRLDAKLQNLGLLNNNYGIKNGEGVTNYVYYVYHQVSSYIQIAVFNTDNQQLNLSNIGLLGNYQSRVSQCSGACLQCEYLFNLQGSFFTPGDWLIAGSFSISDQGPLALQPYICGSTRVTNGPQYTMAMLFALNQVNSGQASVSVPGVKFGGLALDHCNNPGRAKLMVSTIFSGFLSNNGVDPSKILAWITDNTASTNETATILKPLDVAIVSPSATSPRLMDIPKFFRTIQGDRTAALALIKIVKFLGYPYIQVVYGANDYGRGGMEVLTSVSQSEGICIIGSYELSSNNSASTILRTLVTKGTDVVILFLGSSDTALFLTAVSTNSVAKDKLLILMPEPFTSIVKTVSSSISQPIISLRLQSSIISKYSDYINNLPLSNPYFQKYYMALKNCNLPGYSMYTAPCPTPLTNITNDPNYVEDNYILPTINSVYAIVKALHLTLVEDCKGGYTSPCAKFYASADRMTRFNSHLQEVSFVDEGKNSFQFLEREGNTIFEVVQYSRQMANYVKIGTYAGLNLDLQSMTNYINVTSNCQDDSCLVCTSTSFNFSHIPGDVYIAGIFDVHKRSLSPFTCGNINPLNGYLLLEAFHYAISKVNQKEGQFANILPGVTLGGVGLDACNSQVLGGYLVSNIMSGYTTLVKNGIVVDPSRVDTFVGAYSSKASIYLARLLSDLKIPQVSYAAGSQELNDTRIYPYFFRTVPTDGDQVEAMLKFLNMMDIRYIQILYEDNSNGQSAKDALIAMAKSYRICVAQTVPFPDLGVISPETSNEIVSRLIQKPVANTVVTFLSVEFVNSLLKAIARSSRAQNRLRFVGSTGWADSRDAILDAEQQAVDSVTLKLDSNSISEFETYMSGKTLANSVENPWFEEYYQYIWNCFTSKAHTLGYPGACTPASSPIITSGRYQQDPGVVYVINAVYASAFALHKALEQKCGVSSYSGVCQGYRSSQDRRDVIRNNLASVTFDDPAGHRFEFVNRSAKAGYRLQSLGYGQLGNVGYTKIGTYNVTTGDIVISSTYTSKWDSNCVRREACAECPEIRDNDIRYVFMNDPSLSTNATTIVGFFDIHKLGVDPYRCGDFNLPGFQQFLAFFYSAQKVADSKVKGKVRILAIDTCSNSLRVDQDLFGLLEGTGICNIGFDNNKLVSINNLGGVVTLGEMNTMAAARLLESPRVTYLSPNAVSSYLDDNSYLLRTIAPNKALVRIVVDLFRKLGWQYLDILYELNSPYGLYYLNDFNNFAQDYGLCQGTSLGLEGSFTAADIQLSGSKGSKVVVLFGSLDFIRNVFAASSPFIDQYIWVLGGDWTLNSANLGSLVPKGTTTTLITLRRLTYGVKSFLAYMNSILRYDEVHNANSASIPLSWFDEFYQTWNNCTLINTTKSINQGWPMCNTKKINSFDTHEPYALNTILALYAAATGVEGVQPSYNNPDRRNSILQKALKVNENLNGGSLGDLNLNATSPLTFDFDQAMHWWNSGVEMRILKVAVNSDGSIDVQIIKNVTVQSTLTDSQTKDILAVFNITSLCTATSGCICSTDSTARSDAQISDFQPTNHRNYYLYNDNGSLMYEWPIWAIVVAILTSLGLLVTIILFLVLVIAYPVRGGTTLLGYMVIVGILGIYVINFAFFVNANEATCGSRRFLMGVVYMIAFAPLLIKALDNWRFGQQDEEKEIVKDRYVGISSACSLFCCALLIVLVQCIIPIIWLILVHPTASYWPALDGRHDNWWCDPPQDYDEGIVLSMVFVMFIVLLTGIFSATTLDAERNNYESRWICASSIVTAGCFLVWMIVSTRAGPHYRDAAVTIGNLINATLLMLIMPFRKSVLLCISKRGKKEDEYSTSDDAGPVSYNNGQYNPGYDLQDFDMYNSKPSEF